MPHTFERFSMVEGTDQSMYSRLVVGALQQAGKLKLKGVAHTAPGLSIDDEEVGLAAMDATMSSVSLARPRAHVLPAFQALVRDAFKRHNLPVDGGLDVGSGATGYMVAHLLPPAAQATWLQMELNPEAAKMNRDNNSRQVILGSYHKLREQGAQDAFHVVTGLSSLDATEHVDHAVDQIHGALKSGGYLLHVQDARPGVAGVHQQLRHAGEAAPYSVVYLDDANARPNDILLYRHGGVLVDVVELFRRRLGRAIADHPGFELLQNEWMTAEGPGTHPLADKHVELGVFVGVGKQAAKPIDAASAVITVARKK